MQQEMAIPAIWRQAFRPFFLLGALFAATAIIVWVCTLTGVIRFSPYGQSLFWHAHEMIFGFAVAIIVGFLLTAVQNWTGQRATNGMPLLLLCLLWLAGRILMAFDFGLPNYVVAVVDVLLLPAAAILMAILLLKAQIHRNLIMVAILIGLAVCNWLTHSSVLFNNYRFYQIGLYGASMLITLLMIVMSGRVVPMFTANGSKTRRVENLPWLERLVFSSALLIVIVFISGMAQAFETDQTQKSALAILFIVAALANAFRAWRWRLKVTLAFPLLWSLHLAYWFIPLGFLLFALHYLGFSTGFSNALHALTAGAMGSLILAMIARVSLGHSGRPLNPAKSMSLAFVFVILGALIRILVASPWFIPYFSTLGAPVTLVDLYWVSGGLWSMAFIIYVINYFKILTTPRLDGKPG